MTSLSDSAGSLNRLVGGRVAWYMKYDSGPRRTQAQLGELLGIDQSSASKKLKGERPFSIPELYAIADWLGLDMQSLTPSRELLEAPPVPSAQRGELQMAGQPRRRATDNSHGSEGTTLRFSELQPA